MHYIYLTGLRLHIKDVEVGFVSISLEDFGLLGYLGDSFKSGISSLIIYIYLCQSNSVVDF